ncbi:hypothetical protein [uncultured Demequina sp.]|uniref:hypothetical protein n=1 Tax=uncultured Demequina sp. TaxID=693499 RepID=UPI0025EE2001|nr:hypothetical protein [uncultured Demequina sp.]
MTGLRTVVSAICIIVGAFLVAAWAVSSVVVNAVEDGTALRGIAERALDTPAVRAAIASDATDRALGAIADAGAGAVVPLVEGAIATGIDAAVDSPGFKEAALDAVDDAHAQFTEALTDALREPAPLVIEVDVSDAINARIDDLPAVGEVIPEVTVPPVAVEALDAETFETTRSAYARIAWTAAWGLWCGIASLTIGILVSARRRWFVPKVLLALGVISLAFGAAIAVLGPETITRFVPGGDDGALSTLWRDVLTEEAAPVVMRRATWLGAAALAGAAVAAAFAALTGRTRR